MSVRNPGRSFQDAKTHRLLARIKLVGVFGLLLVLSAVAEVVLDPGVGDGKVGGELQDTKRDDTSKTKLPTMHDSRSLCMGLILLEALLALLVLLLIVWWTMFSGRKKGELLSEEETHAPPQNKDQST